MKYFGAFLACLMAVAALFLFVPAKNDYDYLRIHIRANSNLQIDQQIKYLVKDEVVNFLTPHLTMAENKEAAISIISCLSAEIENIIDRFLADNNFDYQSEVCLKNEVFPARTYEGLTLKSGSYDALIINLGSGQGDNWWCVVYPPLCFVTSKVCSENIYYKSKLKEIIDNFFR